MISFAISGPYRARGHDIGEKSDIGYGKERVCPDMYTILGPISGKIRYRVEKTRYRVWQGTGMSRYVHDIGTDIDDIGSDIVTIYTISCLSDPISGNTNIGTHSDIGPSVFTISDVFFK